MDAITETLRAAQKPIRRCLWTDADAITFTPAVLELTFGDGRALFALTTINNRPAYWIVRGCSTWETGMDSNAPDGAPEFMDQVEDIIDAIEDEFGGVSRYERNINGVWIDEETKRFVPREWTSYPAIDSETGCSWGRLDWPSLEGIELEPHPFARRFNILANPAQS